MKGLFLAFQRVISAIVAIVYSFSFAVPSVTPSTSTKQKDANAKNNRPPVVLQVEETENTNGVELVPDAESGYELGTTQTSTDAQETALTEAGTDAAAADERLGGSAADEGERLTEAAAETPAAAEETAPAADETAAAAEEAAPAAEETAAQELQAVETWDVSATEEDNVTMSYYDTADAQSVIDQLAGCIKSLFVPMTAYAATEVEIHDTALADPNAPAPASLEEPEYENGTVVISGTGNMVESVYNEFVSIEKFAANTEQIMSEYYGVDVRIEYDETLTDLVEIDSTARWFVTGEGNEQYPAGTEVRPNDEIRDRINSTDMLKYSPKTIIIEEGVENISDFAFLFCGGVETVVIPSTVKSIGTSAFAYCSTLQEINLPEGLEEIYAFAFMYCKSLTNITIPASVTGLGDDAFIYIAEGSVITFRNAQLAEKRGNKCITEGRTTIAVEEVNQ